MDKTVHSDEQVKLQELLIELRKAKGLRQLDVAETINEPQSFVSKYESGERRLDILELREITKVLGITLVEFVKKLETKLKK